MFWFDDANGGDAGDETRRRHIKARIQRLARGVGYPSVGPFAGASDSLALQTSASPRFLMRISVLCFRSQSSVDRGVAT
ncbi:MAG: hypothetical protein M2R45_04446 [Verrucomicrobia subdivision 3 bacterium]|nr:hypothetical protein [Limisphaerales bacterium]MCS1415022.1 hypothetical protein [Limisphaerales bacterium]